MALPAAVQKQVEEAEALQQQLYPENTESVLAEQPAAPEVGATEAPPSNVVELPKQAEPAPTVEAPKADSGDDVAYWKKRFETVQGILNAEVPRLNAQLKEQTQRIEQMLAQSKEQKSDQAPSAQESKDVEEYGDLIEVIDRRAAAIARQVAEQYVANFRKDVGQVQEAVGHVRERVFQSESEKFWTSVMSLVPDWPQIDADPRWIEWLDTTPEFAEDTYRELATKAIAKGDAQKIANLVAKWRGPTPETAQRPAPHVELQRQVAPSTTKSGATPPQQAKIWTRAEYEAAMDPRNVQRVGQKEADRLESEANLAVAEGRVRW